MSILARERHAKIPRGDQDKLEMSPQSTKIGTIRYLTVHILLPVATSAKVLNVSQFDSIILFTGTYSKSIDRLAVIIVNKCRD